MSFNKPDDSRVTDVMLNLEEIDTYDSCQFGKLLGPDNENKLDLLKKGICHYEKLATTENQPEAQVYCKLGHLQLLLEDYNKALSAYNKYFHLQKNYWKNSPFLFGLGIVYYHFSAYDWTIKLFQQLLYNDPGFCRVNEVHCRLGLVFKITGNHVAAIKHFCRSLLDCKTCSITKSEIHFHLGHLFEIQGKFAEARREYELIIELPAAQVKPFVQASTFRQLGWMYHSVDKLGDATARAETALKYLQRSIEIDPNNGHTWYYLGRYYSSMGKVHDAFVSYRQSIDKSEANADTWCSIGVLYQEQNQPMDALQAYICAVQLDRSHEAAWRDLAILYEACQQPKDALVCYVNAQHCLKNKNEHVMVEDLDHRIKSLKEHVSLLSSEHVNKNRILPSIEEAWTLPIPAELSQRQSAFRCPPSQQKRPGQPEKSAEATASLDVASTSIVTHPPMVDTTATHLTSLPGSTSHRNDPPLTNSLSPSKRRKLDSQGSPDAWPSPSWYLTPPQMQVLQNLKLNHSILTPHQQLELERLEHNYALMTKHQKILKEDVEMKRCAATRQPTPVLRDNVPAATAVASLPGNSTSVISPTSNPLHNNPASTMGSRVTLNQSQSSMTHNGDAIEKEVSTYSKVSLLKKLSNEQTSPLLKQVNCVNGAFSPHSISTAESLPPSSTSILLGQNCSVINGPVKESTGEESKHQYSKLVSENCTETRLSEDGKYNSVMDTPQDTPSSDSSLLIPATAHPLQLQAQLSNHVKQLNVHNCSVASIKPSPPSSLTSRHSGDGVLSPNVQVPTDSEQPVTKTEVPEICDDGLDPPEKLAYSLSTIHGRPLPPLLCPIGIPEDVPAREVITTCRKLTCNGLSSKHYYLDKCPPPSKPVRTTKILLKEDLSPPAPTIYLESKKEAMSRALADFCTNPKNPVTVIRGLAAALKLDLGLFSTKTLVESNPDCTVEVRTQAQQPSEENWDQTGTSKVWLCESNRSYTSIAKYAQYQATTFQEQLQEEESKKSGQSGGENKKSSDDSLKQGGVKKKSFKTIKFGTNIDLSNEKKWRPQLQELSKLPWLFRLVSAGNMLSHVGHNILGMNTIQLYMKVPGSRTPGHQENNNYSAININIGPGDCEWFAVPEEYWGEIDELCGKHNIDYLSGSWWPILEDLYHANIPVYRFIQKPGDMIWLNSGTVHWVQAVGWCNNIAWNVGLVSAYQYQMSIERYEWNKFSSYKSIVPLVQLTWNMAQHVRVADSKLFSLMKTCMMRSLWQCQQVLDNFKRNNIEVIFHGKNPDEPSHYCETCEVEVFNLLFVRRSDNLQTHLVHCLNCARNMSSDLENFVVLNQYHTDELMRIYDQFCLAKKSKT